MEILITYIVGWLIFGTLWANYFLNKRYRYEIRGMKTEESFENSHLSKYETYPKYVTRIKTEAYSDAAQYSKVDRIWSFLLCGMIWPVSIFWLAGFYFVASSRKTKLGPLGISKAARDAKKSVKELAKAEEQEKIEIERNAAWNAMVDLLNEQKINHMNYKKR